MRAKPAAAGAGAALLTGGGLLAGVAYDPDTEIVFSPAEMVELAQLDHEPGEECGHVVGFLHDDPCKACDFDAQECVCVALGAMNAASVDARTAFNLVAVAGSHETWCGCLPKRPAKRNAPN